MLLIFFKFLFDDFIYSQPEEIELESEALEYGQLLYKEELVGNGRIQVNYLKSDEFIDNIVNSYLDKRIEEFKKINVKTDKKVMRKSENVNFSQIIDTYKVNDNIIGVKMRITTKINGVQNVEFIGFNFRLDEKTELFLEDLFAVQYKEKIGSKYSDNYCLEKDNIVFFHDLYKTSCTYYELRDYALSNMLNAENYGVTEEEYNKIVSSNTETEINAEEKMVAITFDDGPHATNTNTIVEILKKYNANATFFMLGENVEKYPDVVKNVYNNGNEIGIHTWNHPQLTKLSEEKIVEQVENTSNAIYELIGQRPTLVRPPYGAINDKVKQALNYPLILWSIDSLDWKSKDENQIVPLVLGDVQDGDIILLHDIHSTTIPAADKIIESLKEQRISGCNSITVIKSQRI